MTRTDYSPKYNLKESIMEGAKKWIKRLDKILKEELSNHELNNEKIAQSLATSERNLFRKVKELTGLPPQKYLRRYRMQLAMEILQNGECRTVKETAHAVGYLNVSYFIRQFDIEFGRKPFQILQEEGWR